MPRNEVLRGEVRDAKSTYVRRVQLGGTVALTAVGVILAGCSSNQGNTDDRNTVRETTNNSSTSDDWLAAACMAGTFRDGAGASVLGSADGGTATCQSQSGATQMIIGSYSSQFKLENDVVGLGPYATLVADDGSIQVFLLFARNSATKDLQPLSQFGFEVNSAIPR